MTMSEVSELTGKSIDTLRYYRAQNIGPKSWKLGRRVVYDFDDVEAWMAECRASH